MPKGIEVLISDWEELTHTRKLLYDFLFSRHVTSFEKKLKIMAEINRLTIRINDASDSPILFYNTTYTTVEIPSKICPQELE